MQDKNTANDASHFVKTWMKHRRDLEVNTLPYLDSLMDALTHFEPSAPDDLRQELYLMIPLLQYGTARRIVDLKFQNPPENVQIPRA